MTTNTPRQRIQSLLKIHGGHCFIVMCCEDFEALATEAAIMAVEGLVTIASDNGGAVAGLDVKRKGLPSQACHLGRIRSARTLMKTFIVTIQMMPGKSDTMHAFPTKDAYLARAKELLESGESLNP